MTITGIIVAVVVGAVIGGLARLALPGRQSISTVLTVVVGIVAALLGTVLARALGVGDTNGFDWIEFAFQLGLAVVGVSLVAGTRGRATV